MTLIFVYKNVCYLCVWEGGRGGGEGRDRGSELPASWPIPLRLSDSRLFFYCFHISPSSRHALQALSFSASRRLPAPCIPRFSLPYFVVRNVSCPNSLGIFMLSPSPLLPHPYLIARVVLEYVGCER